MTIAWHAACVATPLLHVPSLHHVQLLEIGHKDLVYEFKWHDTLCACACVCVLVLHACMHTMVRRKGWQATCPVDDECSRAGLHPLIRRPLPKPRGAPWRGGYGRRHPTRVALWECPLALECHGCSGLCSCHRCGRTDSTSRRTRPVRSCVPLVRDSGQRLLHVRVPRARFRRTAP